MFPNSFLTILGISRSRAYVGHSIPPHLPAPRWQRLDKPCDSRLVWEPSLHKLCSPFDSFPFRDPKTAKTHLIAFHFTTLRRRSYVAHLIAPWVGTPRGIQYKVAHLLPYHWAIPFTK